MPGLVTDHARCKLNRFLLLFAILVRSVVAQSGGFSITSIDKSVDPCTNFYQFACGTWIKTNPVPSDQPRWGRFNELQERNERILKDILETSSAKTTRSPVEQKIGDYYQACMDEAAIEKLGTNPLKPYLQQISGLKDKKDVGELVGKF